MDSTKFLTDQMMAILKVLSDAKEWQTTMSIHKSLNSPPVVTLRKQLRRLNLFELIECEKSNHGSRWLINDKGLLAIHSNNEKVDRKVFVPQPNLHPWRKPVGELSKSITFMEGIEQALRKQAAELLVMADQIRDSN